jgi:hypothetical protein
VEAALRAAPGEYLLATICGVIASNGNVTLLRGLLLLQMAPQAVGSPSTYSNSTMSCMASKMSPSWNCIDDCA